MKHAAYVLLILVWTCLEAFAQSSSWSKTPLMRYPLPNNREMLESKTKESANLKPQQSMPYSESSVCSPEHMKYFLAFHARVGFPGHAFVSWIEIDTLHGHTSKPAAFGFYPEEKHRKISVFKSVPGEIREEIEASSNKTFRIQVSPEDYARTKEILNYWNTESKNKMPSATYDLYRKQCVKFIDTIARSIKSEPLTIPKSTDFKIPQYYVGHLYFHNKKRHLSIEDMYQKDIYSIPSYKRTDVLIRPKIIH